MSAPTPSDRAMEWPESRARHLDDAQAHITPEADAGHWVDDRLADVGVVWSPGDFDVAANLELEFLTELVWAPAEESRRVVHALVGDRSVRAVQDHPVDAIPLSSALFLSPPHEAVFGAVVDLVDADTPLTPTLVAERVTARGDHGRAQRTLLDMAAPTRAPLPGGVEASHLAEKITDGWYRRGYIALTMRMQEHTNVSEPGDLAGAWRTLSTHQQSAERRWRGVHERLQSRTARSAAPLLNLGTDTHRTNSPAATAARLASRGTAVTPPVATTAPPPPTTGNASARRTPGIAAPSSAPTDRGR